MTETQRTETVTQVVGANQRAPVPNAPPATPANAPAVSRRAKGSVAKTAGLIFAPILWIVRPFVFRIGKDEGNPKIHLTSFSQLIYLWPILAVGIVNTLLAKTSFVDPAVLGWIWITVVMLVLIAMGADLDRNKAIILALLLAIFWLGGALIGEKASIPVLSHIRDFFASQNVQFDPGTARVFSIIVTIILAGVVVVALFDGGYEITTREITHRRLFFTSDSLPRAAKRIKRDWRDLTEVIFGLGAGDLIVIDSNRNEVMRIPNIPFLWFFRHDVDHILEVLATTDADETTAEEADDAS